MHAILTSVGTDGDLIPYVGIGTRLVARSTSSHAGRERAFS